MRAATHDLIIFSRDDRTLTARFPPADVFPCFEVIFGRVYRFLFKPCLQCCCGWQFTDDWKPVGDKPVDWVRAADLNGLKGTKVKLYEGKIEVCAAGLRRASRAAAS